MLKRYGLFFMFLFPFLMNGQELYILDSRDHEGIADVFVIALSQTFISENNGSVLLPDSLSEGDTVHFQHPAYYPLMMSYEELRSSSFQVIMDHKTIALEEFTVSAQKWKRSAEENPMRVVSVRRDQLSYQPSTTADLMAQSDEVYVQKSQQGGGSPMLRGFAANRILLVYDGMRVNNAIFRSGNLQNIILFDARAMEVTEVIYGPSSTLYGSDALGGVIDFRTIDPGFANDSALLINGSANFGFSSAAKEGNGHLHFSLSNDKYYSFTSFSFSQFGNLRMGSTGPDDYLRNEYQTRINGVDSILPNADPRDQVESGYKQFNMIQKFGFKLNENSELGVHFSLAQTGDVPRYDRLIQEDNGGLKYAEWFYGPNVWLNTGISFVNTSSNAFFDEWKTRVDYQFYKESRHDRKFNDDIRRNRLETVKGVNANLDFLKTVNEKLDVFYGLELWYNRVGSEANTRNVETNDIGSTSTRYPDGSDYINGGIYAMINYSITGDLNLSAGLRYNGVAMQGRFDTTYYSFSEPEFSQQSQALTPSLGLVYQPSDNWRWQMNVAQGFRAPNIDDVAKVFDSAPGNVVVPNTDLKPEKVWSFDLGATYILNEKLQLEASAFYSILQDVMVRADHTFNGQDSIIYDGELSKVEAIQNLGDGWISGIQGAVKYAFGPHLSVKANAVYVQGMDGNNDPLRHVAPFMSAAHIDYINKYFRINLNLRYNGEIAFSDLAPSEIEKAYIYAKDDNGNPYSPSWYTVNLNASWFVNSKLRLDLSLGNLLDARYRSYSSGISAAGFDVKGSLVIHF